MAAHLRVVKRLNSSGGIGIVYEVEDTRALGRRFALKVLREEYADDPAARSRFQREAEAAKALSDRSEHVVKVWEVDTGDETPMPWMKMELLHGEDLWTRGRLDPIAARRALRDLGHAMSRAHDASLGSRYLHLDLKPENLFLARVNRADRDEELKVLDFGLTREIVAERTRVQATTTSGTLLWMPPEQGNPYAELGCAADVWPIGLIAFWIFTGKYYWKSVDAAGRFDPLKLYGELSQPLPAASARARELGVAEQLPEGFDEWFALCVAIKPEDRFHDALVAFRALDELVERGSTAPPPPVGDEATPPRRASLPTQPFGTNVPELLPAEPPPLRVDVTHREPQPAPRERRSSDGTDPDPDLGASRREPQPTPQSTRPGGDGRPPKGVTQPAPPPPKPADAPPITIVDETPVVEVRRETPRSGSVSSPPPDSVRPVPAPRKTFPWAGPLALLGAVAALVICAQIPPAPFASDASLPTDASHPADVPPQIEPAPPPPPPPPRDAGPPCPEGMVHIPAGEFWMGAGQVGGDAGMFASAPRHRVRLSAYCIDRTEVTVARYGECVRAGRCTAAATEGSWSGITDRDRRSSRDWCNGDRVDRANHPVNCVDWMQASAYCQWRGGALPTEAQWEYAARGRDERVYPWGNDEPAANLLNACDRECQREVRRFGFRNQAMYEGSDRFATTAPVGSFSLGASPFGVLDLAGNVFEWVEDGYWAYSEGLAVDPRPSSLPPNGRRVLRGGGWSLNVRAWVRAGSRYGDAPSGRHFSVGFRCSRGAFLQGT